MKKLLSVLLVILMVVTMAGCTPKPEPEATEGKVFTIYAWNEEFKGFFEKYFAEKKDDGKYYVGDAEVKWVIVPSDNGAYQDALDAALLNQANAAADDKVDMFLAEADYILKYTDSDATQDITKLGVTDFSQCYQYTVDAASANGVVKGVSFQCCPAALIYRRSIAKDVLGTDDPAEVQAKLDTWEKFDAVAAEAKAKGYYMTASYAATYRVFSNNTTSPWVNANNELVFDSAITTWMDQAEKYVENGYTLTSGIWDNETTAQMFKDGKAMCFFGPAWYYNFSMGNAQDPEKGCFGDWAICQGPQAHFWGGTWLLAAAGADNPTAVAETMKAFINNEEICSKLIENEAQFTNNQKVNAKYATDPKFGNAFLGGQNDVALYVDLAKNIKFQNQTIYDQLMNEGLQTYFVEFLNKADNVTSREIALQNFYRYINEKYPNVKTPQ